MTFHRALFWVHLIIGVSLGLVILSMCGTGTLLAFEPQITQWSERSLTTVIPPAPNAARLSIEQLLARLAEQRPDARPSVVTLKSAPASTVTVNLGRNGMVFLNPYTGAVIGHGSKIRKTLRSVEEWHRWLGNRDIGQPITCVAAIAFFLLTLSGVYLWWPRRILDPLRYPHAQSWSWHNAVGFWLSPFVLIITVTGVMMASGLLGKPPAAGRMPRAEAPLSADALFQDAQTKTPQWTSISLRLPQHPGQTLSALTQPAPRRGLRGWVTPLHTGRAWGVPGQLINLLVAIAGLTQILTGYILVFRRIRRKTS